MVAGWGTKHKLFSQYYKLQAFKELSITAANGSILSNNDEINSEILRHYEGLLGSAVLPSSDASQTLQNLVTTILHADYYPNLIAYVTKEEIHLVVKGLPNNKSPGPNGFTSDFLRIPGILMES